jgi:hypothetical protein
MTMYFDTQTGQLIDDQEAGGSVEAGLAQRRGIVPVEGRALEVVEAGNEKLGEPDEVEDTSRPEAAESSAEAKKAHEGAEKERLEAHKQNLAAVGTAEIEAELESEELPADGTDGENTEAVEEQQAEDNALREELLEEAEAQRVEEEKEDRPFVGSADESDPDEKPDEARQRRRKSSQKKSAAKA